MKTDTQRHEGRQDRRPLRGARSYDRREVESERSVTGAPTRGFEYENYDEYEDIGLVYQEVDGQTVPDHASAPDNIPNEEQYRNHQPYEADDVQEIAEADEVYAGDPDIEAFGQTDLRYAGEDISGQSEWSMRAQNLELDDGLDSGDFHRSDAQILEEAREVLAEQFRNLTAIELNVEGSVLYIDGDVHSAQVRQHLEDTMANIPGVKEVSNRLLLKGD